jgi:hypothetical protein
MFPAQRPGRAWGFGTTHQCSQHSLLSVVGSRPAHRSTACSHSRSNRHRSRPRLVWCAAAEEDPYAALQEAVSCQTYALLSTIPITANPGGAQLAHRPPAEQSCATCPLLLPPEQAAASGLRISFSSSGEDEEDWEEALEELDDPWAPAGGCGSGSQPAA